MSCDIKLLSTILLAIACTFLAYKLHQVGEWKDAYQQVLIACLNKGHIIFDNEVVYECKAEFLTTVKEFKNARQ